MRDKNYTERRLTLSRPEAVEIAAYHWSSGKPRAIMVIAHGMGEHARRYPPALAQLLDSGFHIYGLDHRGHGETMVQSKGEAGDFGGGGFAAVVDDLAALVALARKENPQLPLILLGHSMGSFISQTFVLDYSAMIDCLVLVGTCSLDVLAASAHHEADLLTALNREFEPARTPFDWLSSDEKEVDKYIDDPFCGFNLVPDSMTSMFSQGPRLADPDEIARIKKDLPIYIMVGGRDPLVTGCGIVEPVIERYQAAGLKTTFACYDEGRHEILNEVNRAEVVQDLLNWLIATVSQVIPAPQQHEEVE
ncbi:MAG: alpha/beta hydrolase [Gammaproteobacteria bacterium]|nr:alpha/beta hydrolase [Gammaproteobacteria bacterium]